MEYDSALLTMHSDGVHLESYKVITSVKRNSSVTYMIDSNCLN